MKKVFEYRGFEDFYDFGRDMEELFEPWNTEFKDLDGEFQNTIRVTIEVLEDNEGTCGFCKVKCSNEWCVTKES